VARVIVRLTVEVDGELSAESVARSVGSAIAVERARLLAELGEQVGSAGALCWCHDVGSARPTKRG
jgi:hypothetical protein